MSFSRWLSVVARPVCLLSLAMLAVPCAFCAPARGETVRGVIANITDKDLVEYLKGVNANGLFFFNPDRTPERATEVIEGCADAGIKVFSEIAPRDKPFTNGLKGKDAALVQPICMNGPFSALWAKHLADISGQFQLDSLGLCPDEFFWSNSQNRYTCGITPGPEVPFYCTCDACRAAFRKEYGHLIPETGRSRILRGNVDANRDFILFRYHSVANAFRQWAEAVKGANPEQKVSIVLSAVPAYALENYPSGICWDIIGREVPLDDVIVTAFPSSYDYRGPETHLWITETTKRLVGAFPNSRVGLVTSTYDLNVAGSSTSVKRDLDGEFPPVRVRPVDIYGNLMSCLAHGGKTFFLFHRTYIKDEKADAVRRGYALAEAIDPWLDGTQCPKDVALLYSRAGEDFYSLDRVPAGLSSEQDGSDGMWKVGGWAQPANRHAWNYNRGPNLEGSLGFRLQKQVIHDFVQAGIQFGLHHLDQLDYADIKDYPVAVTPFPYAISKGVFATLQKYVKGGGQLVLLSQQLGVVNQEGERYGSPLLLKLLGAKTIPMARCEVALGKGRVVFIPGDDAGTMVAETVSLGGNHSINVCKEKGNDVEVILRRGPDDETLAFAINWQDHATQVVLDLPMAAGSYDVACRNLDGATATVQSAEQLRALRIALEPQDVKVFRISKQQ